MLWEVKKENHLRDIPAEVDHYLNALSLTFGDQFVAGDELAGGQRTCALPKLGTPDGQPARTPAADASDDGYF
jgi:hypothetical protein